MTITNSTFDALAFPVVRVRYAGPTNTRGSRWIATLRRDSERTYRVTVGYDHSAQSGARNALPAALKCLEKAFADYYLETNVADYVAIPGDLDANTYVFTFVPSYILNGSDDA